MRISSARSADAKRLTQIAFAAKRTWGYPEDWIRRWAGTLTITPTYLRRHPTFCAWVGKSIAGFCALKLGRAVATVDHLWVAPEHAGRGFGRALFRRGEARAREAGAKKMRIEADPHAEGFYRRMGARTVGRRSAPIGGRRRYLPLLEKKLAPAAGSAGPAAKAQGRPPRLLKRNIPPRPPSAGCEARSETARRRPARPRREG